jgi:hypothetical protein
MMASPLPSYFTVQVFGAPLPPLQMSALERIEVECAVGQATIFRMHFQMSRTIFGDFDVLGFDMFRPLLPVTIRLSPGIGVPLALVNGYVRDTRMTASNTPGQSRLEVVCVDELGAGLAQTHAPFPFPNTSDGNAAAIIFSRNQIVPRVDPVPVTRPMTEGTNVQHRSDAQHLFALAERLGYDLYIQPEPVSGRDVGHLHAPQIVMPPQAVLSIDHGIATNLASFEVDYDALRPTTVATATTDPTTRAPVPVIAPIPTEFPMGLEPAALRVLPPSVSRPIGRRGGSPAEAQSRAMAEVNQSSRAIRAEGRVDSGRFRRPLLVGLPVLIRGAGRRDSGLYQIDRVTHDISRDGYDQTFSAWRNAVGLTGAEVFFDPLSAA